MTHFRYLWREKTKVPMLTLPYSVNCFKIGSVVLTTPACNGRQTDGQTTNGWTECCDSIALCKAVRIAYRIHLNILMTLSTAVCLCRSYLVFVGSVVLYYSPRRTCSLCSWSGFFDAAPCKQQVRRRRSLSRKTRKKPARRRPPPSRRPSFTRPDR